MEWFLIGARGLLRALFLIFCSNVLEQFVSLDDFWLRKIVLFSSFVFFNHSFLSLHPFQFLLSPFIELSFLLFHSFLYHMKPPKFFLFFWNPTAKLLCFEIELILVINISMHSFLFWSFLPRRHFRFFVFHMFMLLWFNEVSFFGYSLNIPFVVNYHCKYFVFMVG